MYVVPMLGIPNFSETVFAWGRDFGARRKIFSQNHCPRKKENGALAKTVSVDVAGHRQ